MGNDMKRTVNSGTAAPAQLGPAAIQVLQAQMTGITRLLRGAEYSGARDIVQALGYEPNPEYRHFYEQYINQDIARAIIDRPVSATWRGPVEVFESHDDEDTPLEKAWRALDRRCQLKRNLIRLDTLAGLGRYAVLFLGLSDATTREAHALPVTGSGLELKYVRPLSEAHARIIDYETDATSPRYGAPSTYALTITSPGSRHTEVLTVHHSRIIHVAEATLECDYIGSSRLAPVYRRLKDLEKLVGGSAEMFWRGARPGYYGNVSPDTIMDEATKTALKEQLDEYEHNLRRFLISSGVDIQELMPQVADPTAHVEIQLQMISAVTGIPKRILTGSERGELASTEDRDNWLEAMQSRREEFVEPTILYPFIERLIEYGALPAPSAPAGGDDSSVRPYSIQWQDLWTVSQKDKAELGQLMSASLRDYLSTPMAMEILPPDMFFRLILGLSDADIELIEQYVDAQLTEDYPVSRQPEGLDEEVAE